jgi:hypothetical protein
LTGQASDNCRKCELSDAEAQREDVVQEHAGGVVVCCVDWC